MTIAPDEILNRLPHGPEFRFLSEITEFEAGRFAKGVWRIAGDEPFFAGHFPGRPLVPGVLICEALAQISGVAAFGGRDADVAGMLVHVDVRLKRPVTPPAELTLESRLSRTLGSLHQFEVCAKVGDAVAARGVLAVSEAGGS